MLEIIALDSHLDRLFPCIVYNIFQKFQRGVTITVIQGKRRQRANIAYYILQTLIERND